ncbi:DUF1775 domain-containing protein [Myxococcus sp. K15C18031901]|uniref:DUF1775 domain-containing protein n=1 Tax=Myxococcus dinghuensis TaxID=2906761 RepID=UPI0020A7D70D|nr:DUF1775 domain-containing protein [Myxococcus dinghuensis]MCP3100297.1 DUF1775 domain-containing protein [Myxococcus dinghuensis]
MKLSIPTLLALAGALAATSAQAHVAASGPAYANTTAEIQLTVGHGCSGSDTYRLKVTLPEGLGGVRPLDSVFGKATLEKDANGTVTAIVWTRAATSEVLPADTHFHRVALRARLPDKPFTTLFFPTTQTCLDATGKELTVEWVGTSSGHDHGSDSGTTTEPEPAPSVFLLPARSPGWNKYTVNEHVHDLSVFNDALIVWAGDKAYSANPVTKGLIETEKDTGVLTEIHPGTEIWVKY